MPDPANAPREGVDYTVLPEPQPTFGSGGRAIFHEAIDEGRMAGYNAARIGSHCFKRLPRRLERMGSRDGMGYRDDSVSTPPHASLAGVDWHSWRHSAKP